MRFCFFFVFVFASSAAHAQFTWAEIGIDGLTCSMCSRSVEMSVRKLEFVEDVIMNLKETTMKVKFRSGKRVEMDALASAVERSGFSVRHVHGAFVFDGVKVFDGCCYHYDSTAYYFLRTGERVLNGETVLTFVGDHFLSQEELPAWNLSGIGMCEESDTKTYRVSIQ
jgi:copper chaperone CopZ